jgi:3-methylcrotonyl-CoA carboxylase alpha subunit
LNNLTAAGSAPAGDLELCSAVAIIMADERSTADARSPWQSYGWMPVGRRRRNFVFRQGQRGERAVTLQYGNGPSTATVGDREFAFAYTVNDEGELDVTLDGVTSRVVPAIDGHELYLRTRNGRFELHWVDPFGGDDEEQVGEDKIAAPLPGTVVAILAEEGAALEKGAPILTLEVMKMEQTLRAPFAGVLKKIKCKVGDIVQEGIELAEIEPSAG